MSFINWRTGASDLVGRKMDWVSLGNGNDFNPFRKNQLDQRHLLELQVSHFARMFILFVQISKIEENSNWFIRRRRMRGGRSGGVLPCFILRIWVSLITFLTGADFASLVYLHFILFIAISARAVHTICIVSFACCFGLEIPH